MKFGVSLQSTTRLAEPLLRELAHELRDLRLRVARRDDFEQLHVARRIEEVRAEEVRLEIGGRFGGDLRDRQAGRVAGDDAVRLAQPVDARDELALRVEVLDDGLDDPVAFADPCFVLIEIADRHELRRLRREERRRLVLLQPVERRLHDLLRDVEQVDRNPGVRKMRGDAAAHGSGADHDGAGDGSCHSVVFSLF